MDKLTFILHKRNHLDWLTFELIFPSEAITQGVMVWWWKEG